MDAKKNDDRKNIVIVGGGGGGSQVARALSAKLDSSKYNLILINPRPYYILLPATARLAVSEIDHLEDRAFVPYDRVFHNGNGTFLQGKVTSIKKVDPGQRGGEVTLDSGERIPYEFLVLAPGAIWPGPLAFPDDKDDVSKFIREGRAALKGASDIVLVGGGAVGIGESDDFHLAYMILTSYTRICRRNQRHLACGIFVINPIATTELFIEQESYYCSGRRCPTEQSIPVEIPQSSGEEFSRSRRRTRAERLC